MREVNNIARNVHSTISASLLKEVKELWNRTIGLKMCVIGDPITDIYHMAHIGGISHDGPIINYIVDSVESYNGGRQIVADILHSCGVVVKVNKRNYSDVCKKHRIVCDGHKVARWTEPAFYKSIDSNEEDLTGCDSYIISSFGLGTVRNGYKDVEDIVNPAGPVFVDCQRPEEIPLWEGKDCDLFATRKEINQAYNLDPDDSGFRNIVIKDGALGCYFNYQHLIAFNTNPIDTNGSGDCFLAIASMMLTVDPASVLHACVVASIASAIKCSMLGNLPVGRDEINSVLNFNE